MQNDDQSTSIYKEIWGSLSSSLNEMISVKKLDQYDQNIKISEEIIMSSSTITLRCKTIIGD